VTTAQPNGVGPVLGWPARHPVPVILAGVGGGFLTGTLVPALATVPDAVVATVVAAAIAITLLPVPLASLGRAVVERRFLLAVVGLNLVVSPVLALILSRVVFRDPDLQLGLLLVLLAPGVGIVAIFVRRAGGAVESLLATAPLMLVIQAVSLPAFMVLFTAGDGFLTLDLSRLPLAVLLGIVTPAVVVTALQLLATRAPRLQRVTRQGAALAVPATAVAAGLVAAVWLPRAAERSELLVAVVPLFVVYLILMTPLGLLVGTAAGLSLSQVRAITFSGAARNGLLVLPIAMAFESGFELVPLVVVLGIGIEVIGLFVYRLLVPSVTQQSRGPLARE
jgi:ACR3 family arsenite efflux pump ArsB